MSHIYLYSMYDMAHQLQAAANELINVALIGSTLPCLSPVGNFAVLLFDQLLLLSGLVLSNG